jgi:hypothetical protein
LAQTALLPVGPEIAANDALQVALHERKTLTVRY